MTTLNRNGANHPIWSYQLIRNSGLGRRFLELVSGSWTKPDEANAMLLHNWQLTNGRILSEIKNSLHPSDTTSLHSHDCAKEAWDYVARTCGRHRNIDDPNSFCPYLNHKYRLAREIRNMSQGEMSVHELHRCMVRAWDEMDKLVPLELRRLDSFGKYRDESRLIEFLLALRDEFEPLRSDMLKRSFLRSVGDAVCEFIAVSDRGEHRARIAELYSLEFDIRRVRQDGMGVIDLFYEMSYYWDQQDKLVPSELWSRDSFGEYRDELRLVQFLLALRDEFEALRRSILQGSTVPSLTVAVVECITEEERLKVKASVDTKTVQGMIDQCNEIHCDLFGTSPLESGFGVPRNKSWFNLPIHGSKTALRTMHTRSKIREASSSGKKRLESTIDTNMLQDAIDQCSEVYCETFGMSPVECGYGIPRRKEGSNQRALRSRHDINEFDEAASLETKGLEASPSCTLPNFLEALSVNGWKVNSITEVPTSSGSNSSQDRIHAPSPKKAVRYYPGTDVAWQYLNPGSDSDILTIMTYNVWFREDVELHKRMEALSNQIEYFNPVIVCLQEVTPLIYSILKQSSWWNKYSCSVSDQMANTRRYFCMQLSKLRVKSSRRIPFKNSKMGRELCTVQVEVKGKPLTIATTHFESPSQGKMYSNERVDQANSSLFHLDQHENVIFCGDMNWDDEQDGEFPLHEGWVDAWKELRKWEDGWTYDSLNNPMVSGNYRVVQKRLDRVLCSLSSEFELRGIDIIGHDPIPGVSYCNNKRAMVPVLPSDHYGLMLYVFV